MWCIYLTICILVIVMTTLILLFVYESLIITGSKVDRGPSLLFYLPYCPSRHLINFPSALGLSTNPEPSAFWACKWRGSIMRNNDDGLCEVSTLCKCDLGNGFFYQNWINMWRCALDSDVYECWFEVDLW